MGHHAKSAVNWANLEHWWVEEIGIYGTSIERGISFHPTAMLGIFGLQMDESSFWEVCVRALNYRESSGLQGVGDSLLGQKHGRLPVWYYGWHKKSAVHQSTETEMGRVVDFQVFHRKASQTSDPDKQHLLADPAVCPRSDSILRKDCTNGRKEGGGGDRPRVCR